MLYAVDGCVDQMKITDSHGHKHPESPPTPQDLSRLFSLSDVAALAYRDFSEERAERFRNGLARREAARLSRVPDAASIPPSLEERPAQLLVHQILEEAVTAVSKPETLTPISAVVIDANPTSPVSDSPRLRISSIETPVPDAPIAAKFEHVPLPQGPLKENEEPGGVTVSTPEAFLAWSGMAVFSPFTETGNSAICANLAAALHARGEQVLLVDATGKSLFPLYFGAEDSRPGLRRFRAPGDSTPSVFTLGTSEPDGTWLREEVKPHMEQVTRTLIDLGAEMPLLSGEVLQHCQLLLVPLLPNLDSLLAFEKLEARLHPLRTQGRHCPQVRYLLTKMDRTNELHAKAQELLRAQAGDLLLDKSLPDDSAAIHAFTKRMTLVDYDAASPLAIDLKELADSLLTLPAIPPAKHSARWIEL